MRFTHCDASLRDCRRRIAAHEWFRRRDGCAPWIVVRRNDGRIIGWGGLYRDPFDRRWGVEVGYHFDPRAWGPWIRHRTGRRLHCNRRSRPAYPGTRRLRASGQPRLAARAA